MEPTARSKKTSAAPSQATFTRDSADQMSAGFQYPLKLLQVVIQRVEVFKGVECDNEIEGRIRKGQLPIVRVNDDFFVTEIERFQIAVGNGQELASVVDPHIMTGHAAPVAGVANVRRSDLQHARTRYGRVLHDGIPRVVHPEPDRSPLTGNVKLVLPSVPFDPVRIIAIRNLTIALTISKQRDRENSRKTATKRSIFHD